jgi:cytochrome c-type biogenesis protein CcmH
MKCVAASFIKRAAMMLCLLCWFMLAMAAQDLYPFDNNQDKAQFARLTQEVRCLVCQNQSIADSNAPFAADLRAEVYRLIGLHNSDAEIKAHLTQRYGAYVLLQPPLASQTWVLWATPLGLLLLGFAVLYRIIIRQSQASVGGK